MKMKRSIKVVLLEPEIPQNTGNITRTAVALGMELILVKPLGFSLDEKYLKRAALDYYKKAKITVYENTEEFFSKTKSKDSIYYFYSRYGLKDYTKANYKKRGKTIYLVFGKETTGINKEILKNNLKQVYRIPTTDDVRSINLSNCVAVISFFASYKNNFKDLSYYEPSKYKGKKYLKNISEEENENIGN